MVAGSSKIRRWCNKNNKQFSDGSEEGCNAVAETRKKSDAVTVDWGDHFREQES